MYGNSSSTNMKIKSDIHEQYDTQHNETTDTNVYI
jgi:hypothetical protein